LIFVFLQKKQKSNKSRSTLSFQGGNVVLLVAKRNISNLFFKFQN
jgi:hypothetical protein